MKFYWYDNKLVVVKSTIDGKKKVYYWSGFETIKSMECIGLFADEAEAIAKLSLESAQRNY